MKRYLVEPELVTIHEPRKVVYRIIDTKTKQTVLPEDDDISVIARNCVELNEADEKANLGSSNSNAPEYGTTDQLPNDIVQAIAISNANSIGEQPAILANLELAQQIFNRNLQQQNAVAQQHAMNLLRLAVVAKYVAMIESVDGNNHETIEKMGKDIKKIFQEMDIGIDQKAGDTSSTPAP